MTTSEPEARAARRRGPVRRLLFAFVSLDSFGSVLMLILVTYAMSVSLTKPWERSLVLLVQIATVWLALRVSRARRSVLILASAVLALAIVVAIWSLFGGRSTGSTATVFVVSSVLYFIAPLSILRAIVSTSEVDQEIVLGAIDAYLLMGMFFAYVYQALGLIQAAPFFQGGIDGTVAESLFFSFTTLTTTGYGNLVPAANPGQSIAVLEMLIGQLFLVTAVAKVINAWRPAKWQVQQGGEDGTSGA